MHVIFQALKMLSCDNFFVVFLLYLMTVNCQPSVSGSSDFGLSAVSIFVLYKKYLRASIYMSLNYSSLVIKTHIPESVSIKWNEKCLYYYLRPNLKLFWDCQLWFILHISYKNIGKQKYQSARAVDIFEETYLLINIHY